MPLRAYARVVLQPSGWLNVVSYVTAKFLVSCIDFARVARRKLSFVKATHPLLLLAERLRGSTHVAPAPVAGPARYAPLPSTTGIHSPAMIIAANRVPRAPSIVARMPSVAGEHAIPISDRTPSRSLYGGHRSSPADSRSGAGRAAAAAETGSMGAGRHVRGSPGDFSSAGSVAGTAAAGGAGGYGHDAHYPRTRPAGPIRRVISPRVAARDSLPPELRDLRTTPVELPIYLPIHAPRAPTGSAAAPRARALGSGDADAPADSTSELPLRELPLRNVTATGDRRSGGRKGGLVMHDAEDRDRDAARPINVTIQLPREAFEQRHAPAAAAVAAREPPPAPATRPPAAGLAGDVLYPIVLPLQSSSGRRRRTQDGRRGAGAEDEERRSHSRSRNREIVVPIVLQRAAPPAPAPAARVEPPPPVPAAPAPADT